MIIRISLFLMLGAFLSFIAADLLSQFRIALLPGLITQLGLMELLSAFCLLLALGLLFTGKRITQGLAGYFSEAGRARRRVLFTETKKQQLKDLFYFQHLQINSLYELKRKHLLRRNNRKHVNALAKTIDRQVLTLKTKLPGEKLKQLRQENQRYRKQLDSAALIELQQKISTHEHF